MNPSRAGVQLIAHSTLPGALNFSRKATVPENGLSA